MNDNFYNMAIKGVIKGW